MSFTVNKLDVVFFQRDSVNTQYEQVNISGSNAIFYLDNNGILTAGRISDVLKTSGTTKASLQSYSRELLPGEPLYSVDTVTVGYPNRLVKYEPDPNNPISYRVTYTQTWTKDTPSGIGIGKTDEEPYVNATLDISGTVIITGSLTVTGFIYGSASYALTASYVEGASGTAISASYALNSTSASHAIFSDVAMAADFALLAGDAITATSASHAIISDIAMAADFALLAGDAITATSASYALTASYVSGSALNSESASYALTSSYSSFASDAFIPYNGNRPIKRSGYIGLNVGGDDLEEFIENFFFPFMSATITINSTTLNYETGSQQTINLNGTITGNDETFFDTGSVMKTGGIVVSGSFASASSYSVNDVNVSASYVYRTYFRVGYNGIPGNISSSTKTVNFNYPYLYGTSSIPNLTGSALYQALRKDFTSTAYNTNKTYNLIGVATYIYFAYPSGSRLISIKDPNNFEVLGSFQFTGSAQVTSSGLFLDWKNNYTIYRLALPADPGGNFSFYFS